LYSFTGGRDGDEPSDSVLADTQGRLLGSGLHGGTHTGGVVFALLPPATEGAPWKEVVLHSFRGADGFIPHSRLAFSPGAIYGATQEGGALRRGNVFVLNP
jgi:hypothetical protein